MKVMLLVLSWVRDWQTEVTVQVYAEKHSVCATSHYRNSVACSKSLRSKDVRKDIDPIFNLNGNYFF